MKNALWEQNYQLKSAHIVSNTMLLILKLEIYVIIYNYFGCVTSMKDIVGLHRVI